MGRRTRQSSVVLSTVQYPSDCHARRTNHDKNYVPRQCATTPSSTLLLLFLAFSCCISLTSASHNFLDEQMIENIEANDVGESLRSALARLAETGTILVDQDEPPNPRSWVLATEFEELQRRTLDESQADSSIADIVSQSALQSPTSAAASSSTGSASSSRSTTPSSMAESASASSTSTSTTTTTPSSPLPSPFDQGFSGNITESCQTFMTGILTNFTFKSCLPFSLLLENSNSFFQASRSHVTISQTLDATCSADPTTCDPLMSSYASNITSTFNCASDLANQNPLIIQAHLGLQSYQTLYTASCLRNPATSSYCFADAVTNTTSPTDSYIYYLPLNISLPGGSQPTCDSCLQNTMAVFSAATKNRASALAGDYVSAAVQINLECGPNWVNQTLAAAAASSGSTILAFNPVMGLFTLTMLILGTRLI